MTSVTSPSATTVPAVLFLAAALGSSTPPMDLRSSGSSLMNTRSPTGCTPVNCAGRAGGGGTGAPPRIAQSSIHRAALGVGVQERCAFLLDGSRAFWKRVEPPVRPIGTRSLSPAWAGRWQRRTRRHDAPESPHGSWSASACAAGPSSTASLSPSLLAPQLTPLPQTLLDDKDRAAKGLAAGYGLRSQGKPHSRAYLFRAATRLGELVRNS